MSEKVPEKPEVTTDTAGSARPAPSSGAESPRTAREPDFDDDVHETHLPAPERQATPKGQKRVSFQDDEAPSPPPKPPRPMSPQQKAEATLIEAFPSIDAKVVKAVLVASGGKVEPAFNALLGMSDPDFVADQPIPRPLRKSHTMTQVESDAMYARQLADHYGSSYTGFGARGQGDPPLPPRRSETGLNPNEMYDDREHSFIDDDLPVIKQNLQKGFQDTKNTINKWIKDFQKKLDGEENDEPIPRPGGPPPRQNFGPSASNQLHGIRRSAEATRRSGERDRYDADPQVLSDDFGHRLELRDDEAPPARPPRPLANPDLFKSNTGVEVSENPTTTSTLGSKPAAPNRVPSPSAGGTKQGKWQPLTSLEPKPELEDRDPFSLGDSDDELEAKKDGKPSGPTSPKKVAKEPKKDQASAAVKPADSKVTDGKPADGK